MGNDDAGGRHPKGVLDLLWGTKERPAPGPKPSLTLGRIAEAGVEVADAEGLGALAMRRVAERLGVTTMALYRYLPGKAELLAVMLEAAIGEPPPLEGVGGGWRPKLAHWARGNAAVFRRHPWSLQAVTDRRLLGPREMAWFEAGLRALAETGLSGGEMFRVVMLVNNYVRGASQLALGDARGQRGTGLGEAEWAAVFASLLARAAADGRYPTLGGILAAGAAGGAEAEAEAEAGGANGAETDADFEFGLMRVLDGIEALIEARAAGAA